jgi:hypothetical protein
MEREILRTALAPGAQCLSLEQLGSFSDGALGADEQAAAGRHVRGCLNCQAQLALLQAVTSDNPRPGEREIVREGMERFEHMDDVPAAARRDMTPRGRWLRFGVLLPVATVAAVLLVAGSFYVRTTKAPRLPAQVTTGNEVTRSLTITVIGDVGDLAEPPRRFEWRAVDRAASYRVRLMEVDRRQIWSAFTSASGVDVPRTVRTAIAPGRTLVWDVTAYDASGAAIAESGPQSFKVATR